MTDNVPSLGNRVLSGAAWIVAGRAGVRLIGVVSTLILARLLMPEDFGLVAVATTFTAILSQMSSFGVRHALIKFQDAEEVDYNTAWTLNVLRGALIALLVVGIAWPVASFYDEPRLGPVMLALSFIPLLEGFGNIRFIDFEKRMDFRPVIRVMVIVKILSFIATISVAFITRSYWALIVGNLSAKLAHLVLSYWLVPFRPRVTLAAWRKLMEFSGWLFGANFINALHSRADVLLLQKFVAAHGVGVFFLAKDLVLTPIQEILTPVRKALFPGLSQLEPGSARFHGAYLSTVSGVVMLVAPIGAGIALIAEEAVPLVLGQKWLPIVIPMQLFGVQIAMNCIGRVALSTPLASGKTRLLFNRSLILLPVRLSLLIVGAYFLGVNGAAGALLLSGIFGSWLNISIANRVTGSSFGEHVRACWRTLVAIPTMALAVLGVDAFLPDPSAGALLSLSLVLGAKVLTGLAVYPVSHLLLWLLSGKPQGPESRILEWAQGFWEKRKPALTFRRA